MEEDIVTMYFRKPKLLFFTLKKVRQEGFAMSYAIFCEKKLFILQVLYNTVKR